MNDPLHEQTNDAAPVLALRPAAAAKALGISPRKLDELVAGGAIPSAMLGERLRVFPVHLLVTWLTERATKAVPIEGPENDA